MIYSLLLVISVIGVLGCALAVAVYASRRPLPGWVRVLLLAIVGCEIAAAGFHLLAIQGTFGSPAWNWFLSLENERNYGATFSSIQLFLVALVALVNALKTPELKGWQRGFWLLTTLVYAYLATDEFYALHETFGGGGPSDNYQIPYGIAMLTFMLIGALALWAGFRRDWQTLFLLFLGLGITIYSGVAIEELNSEVFASGTRWPTIFEEVGEMIGTTIALTGLLLYAVKHFPAPGLRFGRRLIGIGGTAWAASLVFALLFWAALTLRTNAVPLEVAYEGDTLSLLGYEVSPSVLGPNDYADVTLYWRANRPLDTDYRVSVHAVAHPEVRSVAQANELHVGTIPSTAWFPGIVMRRTVTVPLPRNLVTPASYWFTVRLWSGPWPYDFPWEQTIGLPVTSTQAQVFGNDTIVLGNFPALPKVETAVNPSPAYHFQADGIRLQGYNVPLGVVETHTLPVDMWWAADRRPTRQLTQFFHLVQGDQLFTFDQQPFGNRMTTLDWPANLRALDAWKITLPDDMPPGTYEMYTGLYDSVTVERAPVVDAQGQPVPDNRISLGSFTYAPSEAAEAEAARQALNVCYGLSDSNSLNGSEADTLVRMDLPTGATVEIGQTGSVKVEGMTYNADRSLFYVVDEHDTVGQFGTVALDNAHFTPIGAGLVTPDNLARNPVLGEAMLIDIDSIAYDYTTDILWGIQQDEMNLLFQINPETGEIVRNAFGRGTDYLKLDLTGLGALNYNNLKDLAIDPDTGRFMVVAGSEAFDSLLATFDLNDANAETGLIPVRAVTPITSSANQQPIDDVEALSFAPDGMLYTVSTNNSNTPENYDRLWRLDPETGIATPIERFPRDVDFVDFEAIACNSSDG